jgi:hypothetical protein
VDPVVQLAAGSTLSWTIPADDQPRLVQAIVNRVPGPGAVSDLTAGTERLGAVQCGGGPARTGKGHAPARPRLAASGYLEMIRNCGEAVTPSHQSMNCAITVSVSCQLETGTHGTPTANTG